ncbi:MAG: hypothetical protein K9L60_04335 [Methylovulum sp.]|nr:hypothetical protein [Methylovulum sp.]MCF7998465.1 hypothetical protein [Methylovulum sp.]
MSIEIGSAQNGLTAYNFTAFGEGRTFAFGQTFKVPDNINTVINSFTFWIDPTSGTSKFKGYLAEWINNKAGSILWQSNPYSLSSAGGYQKTVFTGIDQSLDASKSYVFFIAVDKDNKSDAAALKGTANGTEQYSAGHIVYSLYTNLGQLSSSAWYGAKSYPKDDFEFLATFSIPLSGISINANSAYSVGSSGLKITDMTNPSAMASIGSYKTTGEAFDISVKGTLAYIADGSSGLQIIDVSNPSAPTRLSGFDTAGTAFSVAVSADDYAYIADGDQGLKIIDVFTPNSPAAGGGFDTTGTAYDVAVSGNYAYVADGDSGLQVIDISNPLVPVRVGGIDTTGTAYSITLSGATAYVADGSDGLQLFNISNPATPTRLGGLDTNGTAISVVINGTEAYVADGSSLKVIDVSNPATPVLLQSYNNSATSVAVADHYAYVGAAGAVQAVRIIPNIAPTGSVIISGNAIQGQTLTASNTVADGDGLGTITYTWKAGGTAVGTGDSYKVLANDAGKLITATASYTDAYSTAESITSAATSTVVGNVLPTGTVTISGSAVQGQILTAHNTLADDNGLGAITYTWTARTSVVATGDSYTLTAADVGKTYFVTASYTDSAGVVESKISTVTAKVADSGNLSPLGAVTIAGNAITGQTLTASNNLTDADGLGTITYQWQANGVAIGTGSRYTLTSNEVGKTITATASYTDQMGTAESVASAATAAVTAPVVPPVGDTGVNLIGADVTTSEQGDTAVFNVSLKSAPNRDVTISFVSSDTTEGQLSTAAMTFTAANWSVGQALTVTGQNDGLLDGNIAYSLNASLSTLDVLYKNVKVPSVTLTNLDTPVQQAVTINGSDGTDILIGTEVPNYILGQAGDDDLSGGAGNDTIYGSYGNDVISGNEGDDKLYGEQDNDYIEGNDGNDTLDGGLGQDTLSGGAGNDTYYLGYDALDVIDDKGLANDVDVVIMPYQLSKYTLPTGIENGTIAPGTGASSLAGNESDNSLTGNDGKNNLSGAIGRDSLFGGSGDDVLNGGVGSDVLTGGKGKDTVVLDTLPTADNIDKVTDFKPIDDTIKLDNQIFTQLAPLGKLDVNLFYKGEAAHDPNDYVIYNPSTGVVTYDSDASGAGQGVQIAQLGVNLPITNADFVVI